MTHDQEIQELQLKLLTLLKEVDFQQMKAASLMRDLEWKQAENRWLWQQVEIQQDHIWKYIQTIERLKRLLLPVN